MRQNHDLKWGELAEKFDEYTQESGKAGQVFTKRDIAETIGVRDWDKESFRRLFNRRLKKGKIRRYRRSPNYYEWVNRDYRVTQLDKVAIQPMLQLYLPFRLNQYASIPPASAIGVAGETSGGKTSFMLEIADLNVFTQPLVVYYWYNEMSEEKLKYRIEDYPNLLGAYKEGRFIAVRQGNFEFADVLKPEAINLIDYIDRDEDFWKIGADIKEIYKPLGNGISVFALQKDPDKRVGIGGWMGVKLTNLYLTLHKQHEFENRIEGVVEIIKCKDWAGDTNPVGLTCGYYTGGKHGKLFMNGEWKRKL